MFVILILMALLPVHAARQPNWDYLLHEAKRGDIMLSTRYYKVNVWSVKTSTRVPRSCANWTLSKFSAPLDTRLKKINFGGKRRPLSDVYSRME